MCHFYQFCYKAMDICRLFTWYDKNQKLKNLKSKLADYLNTAKSMSGCLGLSSALDARLELGLETQAELRLRVCLVYPLHFSIITHYGDVCMCCMCVGMSQSMFIISLAFLYHYTLWRSVYVLHVCRYVSEYVYYIPRISLSLHIMEMCVCAACV